MQEEECDEVFRKICYIEMVDIATNVTTNVCRRPLVKDCNPSDDRETICRTEYQSECWSKQIPHEVSRVLILKRRLNLMNEMRNPPRESYKKAVVNLEYCIMLIGANFSNISKFLPGVLDSIIDFNLEL